MPPKTLPEKSDVIMNTFKYFETLTDSEDKHIYYIYDSEDKEAG